MIFIDENKTAWNESDGYRTFFINRQPPPGRVSKVRFNLENTYGRNLHFGVVTKNDFSLDNKITDQEYGWGIYVREWRARH